MNPTQILSTAAAITFAAGIALAGTGERVPERQAKPATDKESGPRRDVSKVALKKRKVTGSNLPVSPATAGSTYVNTTTSTRVYTEKDFAWEGGDVARFLCKQPGIR